jgi:hypothetical protein
MDIHSPLHVALSSTSILSLKDICQYLDAVSCLEIRTGLTDRQTDGMPFYYPSAAPREAAILDFVRNKNRHA